MRTIQKLSAPLAAIALAAAVGTSRADPFPTHPIGALEFIGEPGEYEFVVQNLSGNPNVSFTDLNLAVDFLGGGSRSFPSGNWAQDGLGDAYGQVVVGGPTPIDATLTGVIGPWVQPFEVSLSIAPNDGASMPFGDLASIPEPGSLALLGGGLLVIGWRARRRQT